MPRTATCVWRVSPELVLALDEHLGLPVDSYVNGTQTWLTERTGSVPERDTGSVPERDTGSDVTLEWRLHPVERYRTPAGLSHYEVWEQVVAALTAGALPDSLELGDERRALRSLWDGLECFVPYGDELEPALLARAATDLLERPADFVGLVDHNRIGAEWEQAHGTRSITEMLLAELHAAAPED